MKTCHIRACRRVLFICAALVLVIAGAPTAQVRAQDQALAPSGEAEVLSARDAWAPIRLRTGVYFPAGAKNPPIPPN